MLQMARNGEIESLSALLTENMSQINQLIAMINNDMSQRENRVSNLLEKHCIVLMLDHFYRTGQLLSQSGASPCNDEEYLGGAIGFAQELVRYALHRACEVDVASVEISRQLVMELNQVLLGFDFRNGSLRRKFDGLKYALRSIEDIAFELSLLNSPIDTAKELSQPEMAGQVEVVKGADHEEFKYLNYSEFLSIRSRMETFDKNRENVIKDSRDVQKLSKQAIFAVIRGQTSDAQNKLNQALKVAEKIMLIVSEVSQSVHQYRHSLKTVLICIVHKPKTRCIQQLFGRVG